MIRFEPNSIDYTPANRLQIDFLGAEQILVESSFLMADGQQATVPFDFYVLLHFNAGYSTIAVFPHAELSEEKELVLLDYCIKVIAKKLTDRKLGVDLLANKNSFTHAPNRLGFNKSIYIYKPTVAIRRELIFTFFEERDTRARLRDLIYYQQQWEARRPDIFISHDSSDKASVAEPLYHALVARGLKVWLDKYTLRLGDSLTQKINEGIAECRYGILILSKAFLANERWAKRELSGFSVKEIIEGNNRLIPIWHGIGEDDLRVTNNDWLIDKLGGNTNDGIEALADRIVTDIAEFVSVVPKTQPKQNNLLDSEIINKGQVTPQSSTRKVIIQDIVLKTWKDPVWSKVIAAAILALVGSIWAIIYQYENTTSTSDATPQNISESTQYAKEIASLDTEIGGRLRYFKSNIDNVSTCGDYVEVVGAIVFYQNFTQPIYTVDFKYKDQSFRSLLTRLSSQVVNDSSRRDEVKRALDGLDQIQHEARRPMSDCPTRGSLQEPMTFEQTTSLHFIQTSLAMNFNSIHWQ